MHAPAEKPHLSVPVALDYARKKTRRRGPLFAMILAGSILVPILCGFVGKRLSAPVRVPFAADCSCNLKDSAAALITYANSHGGKYPDTVDELYASSGMTSAVFICPASSDVQAEGSTTQEAAELAAGRHVSYLHLAKGTTSSSPDDVVLACDRPANHRGLGMNVLFDDYRVAWLDRSEMKRLVTLINSGVRPVRWPPPKDK